jgi:hypothetical protein
LRSCSLSARRISMADIGVSLLVVEGTSSPKRRMLKELFGDGCT